MKIPAAVCGLMFLGATLASLAHSVRVIEQSSTEKEGADSRVFLISAEPEPSQVLVVRTTRRENGRKIFEWEEVYPGADQAAPCRITLTKAGAHTWVLREFLTEQHVRGVRLEKLKIGATGLEFELVPFGGDAATRRTYQFSWEAKIEPWATVQKRHPELTDEVRAAGRPTRHVLVAEGLAAGF